MQSKEVNEVTDEIVKTEESQEGYKELTKGGSLVFIHMPRMLSILNLILGIKSNNFYLF